MSISKKQLLSAKSLKKNFIRCPYCAEKIQATAKKCRYCGEWLRSEPLSFQPTTVQKASQSLKNFFLLWLITLIVFFGIITLYQGDLSQSGDSTIVVFLLDIAIGSLAFLVLMAEILHAFLKKETRKKSLGYAGATLFAFCLFFLLFFHSEKIFSASKPSPTITSSPSITVTPIATITPTPTTSPPPKRVTHTPNNPDQPVHCPVPDLCGGGTTPLKKSECDVARCCQVNGKYIFTHTPTECEDTIISCNISPNCGGGIREMRRIDCERMTCCQINGTWELRDKGTCESEQNAELSSWWYSYCDSLYTNRYSSSILMDGYLSCLNNNPAH